MHKHTPVGVGTDVVDQRAVLQHGLHFSQRDVLSCLQLHQVLLTICKHSETAACNNMWGSMCRCVMWTCLYFVRGREEAGGGTFSTELCISDQCHLDNRENSGVLADWNKQDCGVILGSEVQSDLLKGFLPD